MATITYTLPTGSSSGASFLVNWTGLRSGDDGAPASAPAHTKRAVQATVSGTGALTATVLIEVSNDGTNWLTSITISLSGTTVASDGAAVEAPWRYIRPRVSAISGTGAAVTVALAAGE